MPSPTTPLHRRSLPLLLQGLFPSLAVGTLLTLAGPAGAQEKTFYLERLQPSGAPDDGVTLWRPFVHPETRLTAALGLGFALNPLRDEHLSDEPALRRRIGNPVTSELITHLAAGAEIAGRVGIGVSLPVGLYLAGEDPAEAAGAAGPNAAVAPTALHDLRLDARVPLLAGPEGRTRLGLGGALWLPTGNADSFAGDDQTTAMPYVSAEHALGDLLLGGMVGYHFRPDNGLTGSELVIASELRWVLGAFLPLEEQRLRVGLELGGSTGTEPASEQTTTLTTRNTNLEWLAQARRGLGKRDRFWVTGAAGTRLAGGYGGPDLRVFAAIGAWTPLRDTRPAPVATRRIREAPEVELHDSDRDLDGYPDAIDDCPAQPEDRAEPEPTDGCPAGADRDGDGIPDDLDRCPGTPEDRDGVADQDGCPEKDADNDAFPDAEDRCPESAGHDNPDPKRFGCPIKSLREGKGELTLLEPIEFEFDSAVLKPASYHILDDVVAFLRSRPDEHLAVHGHTDDRGDDAYNLRLSQARARSVRTYLEGKGVSPTRLESEGFGESSPVTTNETPEGRAENRRVEFKRVK